MGEGRVILGIVGIVIFLILVCSGAIVPVLVWTVTGVLTIAVCVGLVALMFWVLKEILG